LLCVTAFGRNKGEYFNYENALKNPTDVKELYMFFNEVSQPYTKAFPDNRIKSLVNLEKLYISGFLEKNVDLPKEITDLINLKDLTLKGNNLSDIPSIIWDIKNLKSLDLQVSGLINSNISIEKLEHLYTFRLRCKNIDTLPSNIFKNIDLKALWIVSDDLRNIPNDLGKLINLEFLALQCKELLTIPKSIEQLTKLKDIDVYNRKAQKLEINFQNLFNLESFRWGQSLFFPTSLTSAPNLRRLHLDVSYYDSIKLDSLNFQNLNELVISFSKFKEIPKSISTITTLIGLRLDYNQFEMIEFDFNKLSNLEFVSFGRCSNFSKINMVKLIKSLKTIPNLKVVNTPVLTERQRAILKNEKISFKWEYDD
jgi:Leucine-rich repeat (LRR) protein